MENKKNEGIAVSHINIRQSISILLLKLIALDAIASAAFIVFRTTLLSTQISDTFPYIDFYASRFFLLGVVFKILITIFIVLKWINEYYEIYPNLVRHKSGIIWIKKEQFTLRDIQYVEVEQGLIGKLLNYGTLSLFDWKMHQHQYLYNIHNPMKYLKVVETLLPGIDEEKHIIRERVMEEEV